MLGSEELIAPLLDHQSAGLRINIEDALCPGQRHDRFIYFRLGPLPGGGLLLEPPLSTSSSYAASVFVVMQLQVETFSQQIPRHQGELIARGSGRNPSNDVVAGPLQPRRTGNLECPHLIRRGDEVPRGHRFNRKQFRIGGPPTTAENVRVAGVRPRPLDGCNLEGGLRLLCQAAACQKNESGAAQGGSRCGLPRSACTDLIRNFQCGKTMRSALTIWSGLPRTTTAFLAVLIAVFMLARPSRRASRILYKSSSRACARK